MGNRNRPWEPGSLETRCVGQKKPIRARKRENTSQYRAATVQYLASKVSRSLMLKYVPHKLGQVIVRLLSFVGFLTIRPSLQLELYQLKVHHYPSVVGVCRFRPQLWPMRLGQFLKDHTRFVSPNRTYHLFLFLFGSWQV